MRDKAVELGEVSFYFIILSSFILNRVWETNRAHGLKCIYTYIYTHTYIYTYTIAITSITYQPLLKEISGHTIEDHDFFLLQHSNFIRILL